MARDELLLPQRAHELEHEERVAVRLGRDRPPKLARELLGVEQLHEQRGELLGGEAPQREPGGVRETLDLADPALGQARPHRPDQEHTLVRERRGERGEDRAPELGRQVEILDQHDRRPLGGQCAGHERERVQHGVPAERRHPPGRRRAEQQRRERGYEAGRAGEAGAETLLEAVAAEELAVRGGERARRGGGAPGRVAADEEMERGAVPDELLGELVHEPRLPDARLPVDEQDLARALGSPREEALDLLHLRVAPLERGLAGDPDAPQRRRGLDPQLARALVPPRRPLLLLEDAHEIRGACDARLAVLLHEVQDDLLEERRELRVELGRRPRLRAHLPLDHGGHVVREERVLAGRELVQEKAQGVEVGAAVRRQVREAFGRGVEHGADEHAGMREAQRLVGDERHPEVHQLDVPVGGDEHVLRLDVPVEDARSVDGGERAGDLAAGVETEVLGDVPKLVQELPKRLPLDELHREVEGGLAIDLGLAGVEGAHHVLVADATARLHLPLEAGAEPLPRDEVGVDDLERDRAVGPLGAVDRAHAAGAELRDRPVAIDLHGPESILGAGRSDASVLRDSGGARGPLWHRGCP